MSVSERPLRSDPLAHHNPRPTPKVRGRRARRLDPGRGTTAGGALGWSLANTMVTRLGTLAIGVILARVLGPEEFGTFAVAMVALMAVLSLNELGVSLAIVRWPGDPRRIAATVNTISVASSALFCAAAWMVAPAFASAMGSPEATFVVQLLILSVLIDGTVAGPAALLQREFREKTRMGIDLVHSWTGTVLSLVLALFGLGAMSLAIGRLAGAAISGVLFLRSSPLPYRLGWNTEVVGPLLRFGMPLAGSSAIVFGVGYADQVVVGAQIGPVALGFYVLAFNLSNWPVSIVSQPLRRVAPAGFSVLQKQPERLRTTVLTLFGLLAAVTVPAFLALAGASVALVQIVYGDVWAPAAAALSWLVVAAMVKLFCELVYDLLVVIGRTGTVLWIQCVSLVIQVPALVVGARLGGFAGVAAGQAAVALLVVLPLYLWQLRHVGIGTVDMLRQVSLPLLGGAIAGAMAWLASIVIRSTVLGLAVGGLASVLIIILLLYRRRASIRSLRAIGTNDRKVTSP